MPEKDESAAGMVAFQRGNNRTGAIMTDEKKLRTLTYRELSTLLNIPIGSLYAMVFRGEIPHVRIGKRTVRFEAAAIESWVAARRGGAQ